MKVTRAGYYIRNLILAGLLAIAVRAGGAETESGAADAPEFLGIFTQTSGVRDLDVEYEEIKNILEKNPYISGIAIRVRWSHLNPAEDVYEFEKLDKLIDLIASHDTLIMLNLFPGAGTPMWVFEKGAPRFTEMNQNRGSYAFGQEMSCPVPWDPIYMDAWEKMLRETARRYADDARIFSVGVFGHNYREVEMYMPGGNNMTRWKEEFGWTPEKVEENWKRWIDLYGELFPSKKLDMVLSDLYRDPETGAVRDELIRYAAEKYPGRVIPEHHGLHGNVDQVENPNVRAMQAVGDLVSGGVEFVASYYNDPEGFGSIDMNILNTKYIPNLVLIHIWERDADRPEFSKLVLDKVEEYKDMSAEEMRAYLQENEMYVNRPRGGRRGGGGGAFTAAPTATATPGDAATPEDTATPEDAARPEDAGAPGDNGEGE